MLNSLQQAQHITAWPSAVAAATSPMMQVVCFPHRACLAVLKCPCLAATGKPVVSDVLGLGCLTADYTLTLKRLVLRPAALVPAVGGGGPRLLPQGLFSAAPRNLSLYDVRMILDTKTFADYLGFFRQQLRTARDAAGAGPNMHTVSSGRDDSTCNFL
jgi:hypothetical protein